MDEELYEPIKRLRALCDRLDAAAAEEDVDRVRSLAPRIRAWVDAAAEAAGFDDEFEDDEDDDEFEDE